MLYILYVVNTATFKLVGQPSQFRYRDNCERSKLSSAFNGPDFHYIYIFQVDRHSVNVLNVSTCI